MSIILEAHRGVSNEYPENTLAALRAAAVEQRGVPALLHHQAVVFQILPYLREAKLETGSHQSFSDFSSV